MNDSITDRNVNDQKRKEVNWLCYWIDIWHSLYENKNVPILSGKRTIITYYYYKFYFYFCAVLYYVVLAQAQQHPNTMSQFIVIN